MKYLWIVLALIVMGTNFFLINAIQTQERKNAYLQDQVNTLRGELIVATHPKTIQNRTIKYILREGEFANE